MEAEAREPRHLTLSNKQQSTSSGGTRMWWKPPFCGIDLQWLPRTECGAGTLREKWVSWVPHEAQSSRCSPLVEQKGTTAAIKPAQPLTRLFLWTCRIPACMHTSTSYCSFPQLVWLFYRQCVAFQNFKICEKNDHPFLSYKAMNRPRPRDDSC